MGVGPGANSHCGVKVPYPEICSYKPSGPIRSFTAKDNLIGPWVTDLKLQTHRQTSDYLRISV